MNNEELDDEDHQPYSDGEDEEFNEDEEEEERRIREEFGDDSEEETSTSPTDRMSMTMHQEKTRHIEKEIIQNKRRTEELRGKIARKRQEGIQIANVKHFEECYNFFC